MGRDEEAPKDGACMCCPHNGDNANVTQKAGNPTEKWAKDVNRFTQKKSKC